MTGSPLIVDITPLKRQPGTQRPFKRSLPPPGGVALETAEILATELHLDLLLEVAGEELVVTGNIGIDWAGPCRRCLEDQTDHVVVAMQEIFQRSPIEGETYPLEENDVDLEPMVREAVLLNLPVAPLCSATCAGPDPGRFPTSVVAEDDATAAAAEPSIDPRWAGLSELSFDE